MQSKEEMVAQGVNWARIHQLYQLKGIGNILNLPIDDINYINQKEIVSQTKADLIEKTEKRYAEKIFTVAKNLHSFLVEKKLNVLVYCGTGISRSPTAAMAYLCLFKNVKCWENLSLVEEHIKLYRNCCKPNLKVVQMCIK